MKKIIRLTEGDLHRIVKESVKTILKEYNYKAVNGVETKLKMAAANAQYGKEGIASRMVEDAYSIAQKYAAELTEAIGADKYAILMNILKNTVYPIPVDGKSLLSLITKALTIVKFGYKTDDKIQF